MATEIHGKAAPLVLHGRPDSEAEQSNITDNLSGEQIAKAENALFAFHHWREGLGVEGHKIPRGTCYQNEEV